MKLRIRDYFVVLPVMVLICGAVRSTATRSQLDDSELALQDRISCPSGLSSTHSACYIKDHMSTDDEQGTSNRTGVVWPPDVFLGHGSPLRVSFERNGIFRLDTQFMNEIEAALNNSEVVGDILASEEFAVSEATVPNLTTALKGLMKSGKGLVGNFLPAFSLKVPFIPHSFEVAVHTFHGIVVQLEAGELVLGGIGQTSLVGALAGIDMAAGWIPVVGWALTAVVAILQIYEIHHIFSQKMRHAEEFNRGMVYKSQCVASQIAFSQAWIDRKVEANNFFRPEVQTCSSFTLAKLVVQMQRTNLAMQQMLKEISDFGMCIYPDEALWSNMVDGTTARRLHKIECSDRLDDAMFVTDKRPGLLFNAFSFAAMYGEMADALLTDTVYSNIFKSQFGTIIPPHKVYKESHEMVKRLGSLKDRPVSERTPVCISMLVQHRAFERTFLRFATGIRGYMQTFAREHVSITTRAIPRPCRKVFERVGKENETMAIPWCKNTEAWEKVQPLSIVQTCEEGRKKISWEGKGPNITEAIEFSEDPRHDGDFVDAQGIVLAAKDKGKPKSGASRGGVHNAGLVGTCLLLALSTAINEKSSGR